MISEGDEGKTLLPVCEMLNPTSLIDIYFVPTIITCTKKNITWIVSYICSVAVRIGDLISVRWQEHVEFLLHYVKSHEDTNIFVQYCLVSH